MVKVMSAIDLIRVEPGAEVYGPDGETLGVVRGLSGDRFQLAAGRQLVWVPNDWVTAAHPRTLVVNFSAEQVPAFGRATSSRWARW